MDRRAFVAGMATAFLPFTGEAQQVSPKIPRIGYVSLRAGPSHLEMAFQPGLRERGYVESENIEVVYRYADWATDRLAVVTAELLRSKPQLIVAAGGNATTLAVKNVVGDAIPILFTSGDPVRAGLVARLDRPGGNLTGVSLVTTELNAKRLELLTTIIPGVSVVTVLADPTVPTAAFLFEEIEAAARSLRVRVQFLHARNRAEIEQVLSTLSAPRPAALLVLANPMFLEERHRIVRMAARHNVPAVFEQREFAEAGGLMSYGADFSEMYRRLADYVDRLLKGAKAGDLPVERSAKFELIINLTTARALNLRIPPSLLLRADQVIE